MAPLLEQHKGCDILDINPGVGVWSSKLHDFLQPRTHVLLEGLSDTYEPYLQPLLDAPGSTYKLRKADISQFEIYDELIGQGLFPHQKRRKPGAPGSLELNPSFLVTGNLMWDPMLPGIAFDSLAGQLARTFAKWSWSNQGFHAFGPARMLLWGLEKDIKFMFPKAMHYFQKTGFLVPRTTNITEIVTTAHATRTDSGYTRLRSPRYELQGVVQAMKKGKEKGFELPAHRRENIHDFADDIAAMTDGTGVISYAKCVEYLKEQENAGKSTKNILTDMVYSQILRERVMKDDKKLPQYRATAKRFEINRKRVDEAVDLGWDIYNLECKILGMEDGPEKDAALETLQEMERKFEEARAQLNSNFRPAVYTEIDDKISLSTVSRLQWDMRPFEPLVAKPDEVWPANQPRLYDMLPQPKPDDISLEDWEYEQDFVTAINDTAGRTMCAVPQVLDTVQHGGSALIDEIPILRDPKRGGRLNMEQMRSRMLTPDMIQAMSKAYREWPFRTPEADHPNYFRTRDGRRGGIGRAKGVTNRLRKAS